MHIRSHIFYEGTIDSTIHDYIMYVHKINSLTLHKVKAPKPHS